ncbi:MAG TPA: IS4 family transposase [Gemmatimonadales bacterium]|nr:IS4 family transposase [Gemmatimonadales bacterium]
MARVGQQVAGLGEDRLPGRVAVGVLTRVFPPALVDELIAAAGVGEQRVRVLPARLVVYYNLAMIVFFQSSYGQVWSKLVGGLEWGRSFRVRVAVGMSPSAAAISKARGRLGWKVMADLLEAVAGPLAGEHDQWAHVAGLRLVAFDGLTVDVPDTVDNAETFGRPGGGAGAGAFPQVRVVALAECGSRAVMGARCAGITTGEQTLAEDLLGLLGEGMLVVADRNFLSHAALAATLATGAHVLWRAKADTDLPVLKILPDGTYLSRIADPAASRRLRRRGKSGGDIPGITVRVIEYSVAAADDSDVSELFCLITDLLDPADLSAADAAAAYAQRWEIETAFAELETGIRGGPAVVLRSKSPDMIRQELYALLCVYQAIRTLICHAADTASLDPDRISFTRAKEAIAARVSDAAALSPH